MNESFKPYRVFYDAKRVEDGRDAELNTVVYAVDEEHARDIAPQLFLGMFNMLKVSVVKRIKDAAEY